MKTRLSTIKVLLLLLLSFSSQAAGTDDKGIIELEGRLFPGKDVTVKSQVSSSVSEVLVEEGDHVKKGQVLMRLDTVNEALKVKKAELALEREKIERKKLLSEYSRTKTMHERSTASKEELEKARRELDIAELAVQEAEIDFEQATRKLESTVIESPFDGTVAGIEKKSGDSAIPGDGLVRVIDAQQLLLVTSVSSDYYGMVKPGMGVTLKANYVKDVLKARVETIVPFSDSGDSFKITAVVQNRALKLLPGTDVKCFIKGIEKKTDGGNP